MVRKWISQVDLTFKDFAGGFMQVDLQQVDFFTNFSRICKWISSKWIFVSDCRNPASGFLS